MYACLSAASFSSSKHKLICSQTTTRQPLENAQINIRMRSSAARSGWGGGSGPNQQDISNATTKSIRLSGHVAFVVSWLLAVLLTYCPQLIPNYNFN